MNAFVAGKGAIERVELLATFSREVQSDRYKASTTTWSRLKRIFSEVWDVSTRKTEYMQVKVLAGRTHRFNRKTTGECEFAIGVQLRKRIVHAQAAAAVGDCSA